MNPHPTDSAVGCRGAPRDILVLAMAGHNNRREFFLIYGLTYLLRSLSATMIIGGDINCVLTNKDCIENMNLNRVCGIYISTSVISANQAGSPVATTRSVPMKNKLVNFKSYN